LSIVFGLKVSVVTLKNRPKINIFFMLSTRFLVIFLLNLVKKREWSGVDKWCKMGYNISIVVESGGKWG